MTGVEGCFAEFLALDVEQKAAQERVNEIGALKAALIGQLVKFYTHPQIAVELHISRGRVAQYAVARNKHEASA